MALVGACALLVACGGSDKAADDADAGVECTDHAECDDGNICTLNFCSDGTCMQEPDEDLEGEACDDGDMCTTNVCEAGRCVGEAIDCSGLSDACNTGVCDPATGECTVEVMADDTPCDDATFCTENDVCVSGTCMGEARECSDMDSDCTEGVCDENLAACVASPINEGGDCDDGAFCTVNTTCTDGACMGEARDCSSATDQCNTGVCDETADACVGDPVTDGTMCDDGAFCTPTDQCIAGDCTGSGARDCSGLDDQCNVGVCSNADESCVKMPANEGNSCDDGLFCTSDSTCSSGVCGGGSQIDCGDTDMCTSDSCDEGADTCVNDPVQPIPGAEGPPGDPTCSDGIDNDCDGADDLADANCIACTDNSDCDDGNECTTDVCNASAVCENDAVTDGTDCDDGLFCTTGETCTGGSCGGGSARDCSGMDDDCNLGSCSESTDSCVKAPTNEGGSCSDGLFCTVADSCSGGVCAGADRDCSGAGGPCLDDSCDEQNDECVGTPKPDTTPCDIGFCTVGETCTGGVCSGGSPNGCGDGDTCTTDSCDELNDQCLNPALELDTGSGVFTSAQTLDVCLVAGSDAQVVVWADLVDLGGNPVAGASVMIGGVSATESSVRPGTYYIEYVAASGPSSTSLDVTASACGDDVTLSTSVDVTHEMANDTDAGGLGGCAPMHGNLRVQAVDESGAPVAGASVLVGDAEANLFETNPEALFGGGSSMASNVATTDAGGFATFYDYGNALSSAITTTAGAADRAYVTVADGDASDLRLQLPLIDPPAPSTSLYSDGTATPTPPDCGDVDAAIILPHLDIDLLGTFETSLLFEPQRCWDPNNDAVSEDPVALPQNLWLPAQGPGGSLTCFFGQFEEAPWSIRLADTADTGIMEDLAMVAVDAPLADIQAVLEGGSIADILPVLDYNNMGFELGIDVSGDVSPNSIGLDLDYPNPVTVTFAGRPVETDVVGISAGDYDGTNGVGPLHLTGTAVREFSSPGTQISIPNPTYDTNPPMGVHRVAALTALYLNADDANHTGAIAGLEDGVSTIYVRDDGSNIDTPAFGDGGATLTLSSDLGLGAFLDIPQVAFTGPGSFEWDNVTNAGNLPLFSRHELSVVTSEYLPVLSCATENEVRETRTTHWVVYKPFALDCGSSECFDLPTLPASFPRASTGVQKRMGLGQYVGGGGTCTSTCPVSGEACVDPDGAGSADSICMGGSGTASDPYTTERYEWLVHLYDLEILTRTQAFDFDRLDFADRRMMMTHESTNRLTLP